MRHLWLCVLGAVACGGGGSDLTTNFVGNWSLTTGSFATVCGTMNNTYPHSAGDYTLAITRLDDATLAITLGVYSGGQAGGSCDLTAASGSASAATINAKVCTLGGIAYSFKSGTMSVGENKSLTLALSADFMSGTTKCQETDNSTLALK